MMWEKKYSDAPPPPNRKWIKNRENFQIAQCFNKMTVRNKVQCKILDILADLNKIFLLDVSLTTQEVL